MASVAIPGAGFINGVAATADGTAYLTDTGEGRIYEISPGGNVSVFAEGAPLARPNGLAMDNDGNIVAVNIDDSAVITYNPDGDVVKQEAAVEGGNDGVIITSDGTKYVSSVRFGSVSRIDNSGNAQIIARGIPSAASMCYDSTQNQLVIPMNPHYAMAFIRL
jgi:streptogramin lyase